MASTLQPPSRRPNDDGVLPLDVLHDIMLRLPAKSICRLRAVCTSWHSLLCHPDFIAAAQPGPRIAVGLCHNGPSDFAVSVLDMDSGDVLKRLSIDATSHHGSPPPPKETPDVNPDRAVCVLGNDGRLHLIDPATGAVKHLADPPSSDHMSTSCTLGFAALTGEYKVLAIANVFKDMHMWQICKILTLNDNGEEECWRETGSPGSSVILPQPPWTYSREVAIIDGVAYFLVDNRQHCWIMPFHLASEEWEPDILQGPACPQHNAALASLEGQLVVCVDRQHDNRQVYMEMELWFLVDPDQELWCMRHKIRMPLEQLRSPLSPPHIYFGKPLAVLDDQKIVVWMRVMAPGSSSALDVVLRYYDLRTGDFTEGMQVAKCSHVTVHTWSILHSGRGRGRAALESL